MIIRLLGSDEPVHAPEQLCVADTIKVKVSVYCAPDMYTETDIICKSSMKLTMPVMWNEIQSTLNIEI
jgi:hypothetical protein